MSSYGTEPFSTGFNYVPSWTKELPVVIQNPAAFPNSSEKASSVPVEYNYSSFSFSVSRVREYFSTRVFKFECPKQESGLEIGSLVDEVSCKI